MVQVQRNEYRMARKMGFTPKNYVSKSVSKRHYYLSDYDYARMEALFKEHIK